jgi:peptide/nickel transport system substrate-binding protein
MRLDENMRNIVGVNEYNAGEAVTISGLALSEDKMSLTLSFIEFFPSILANGFWSEPLPRHYLGDIPVAELPGHHKCRLAPIGFGAFKVASVVPGESVDYVRFDDYWRGKPTLDGVRLEVVNPAMAPVAMEEGHFDIINDFDPAFYHDYPDPDNYIYLADLTMVYNYTGFKLGSWDWDNYANLPDPDAKMADRRLRQAIGYAIDNDTIAKTVWNGMRFRATTPITPRHMGFHDNELDGYYYNPELSKRLLDQAGYTDTDGDDFRENPDGDQLTIYWANMEGPGAETTSQFKIQQWAKVGLRVELYTGRLMEFNAFYDAVEGDDPGIDMFDAAWNTGFNPSPSILWGDRSPANYTRYHTPAMLELMSDIESESAWDQQYQTERYKAWQQAFLDDPPAIPTLWRAQLFAVNNRVKLYTLLHTMPIQHAWALTADEPHKSAK